MFSPLYDRALRLAARAHRDQVRKGTDIPYIAHPVHVSVILIRHGFDETLAIAALLHDVVEDCDMPISAIEEEFGPHVAHLVNSVSEHKHSAGVELSWEQRKEDKLRHLRAGGPEVAALKAADALHNARSIIADLYSDGPGVWARFKGSPQQTVWYYQQILASVCSWLPEHALATELGEAVAELEQLLPPA